MDTLQVHREYQITLVFPNGDWVWRNASFADYHAAVQYGLDWAKEAEGEGARLKSVDIYKSLDWAHGS